MKTDYEILSGNNKITTRSKNNLAEIGLYSPIL